MSHYEITEPCIRFRPPGRHPKWTWAFVNHTGREIHDVHLFTNLTYGNDPDIRKVLVKDNGDTIGEYDGGDTVHADVVLDEGVANGESFRVHLECDTWFEEDEAIQICFTDELGGIIDVPQTAAADWPCDPNELLLLWKNIRENLWPFTHVGWLQGGFVTVCGKVVSDPECAGDGDYGFNLRLCNRCLEPVEAEKRDLYQDDMAGAKGRCILHCEITPPFQGGNPPVRGRYYDLEGQIRYDLGHGGHWELHPTRSWRPRDPCELC